MHCYLYFDLYLHKNMLISCLNSLSFKYHACKYTVEERGTSLGINKLKIRQYNNNFDSWYHLDLLASSDEIEIFEIPLHYVFQRQRKPCNTTERFPIVPHSILSSPRLLIPSLCSLDLIIPDNPRHICVWVCIMYVYDDLIEQIWAYAYMYWCM